MPASDYSANYLLYNAEQSKNIVVALQIEGLSTILSSGPIYKRILYGDDITYGQPGLVYGGLKIYPDFKSIMDLAGGSLTISQRLEPEQGRGAISTLSISFVDLNQYMTQLISPGVILDDILGKKITLYLGYQQISFPQDFLVIFRGRVTAYDAISGRVTLQFSDPNVARRQQLFYTPTTSLTNAIGPSDTTIAVNANTDFYKQILGPNGLYDSGVKTYLDIDGQEFVEYPATGYGTNQFTGCLRGQRGTTAQSFDAGTSVKPAIQIQGNPIDLALKFMLSGWDGPYLSDIAIGTLYTSTNPLVLSQPGLITLPPNKDADRDYGISEGDYLTITGATGAGNNTTCKVLSLVDLGNDAPNNAIITDATFTPQGGGAVFSVRSQYDTLPISCGVKLPATEVDVKRHKEIKATFLSSTNNDMRFFISAAESSAKTFIESQIYLPISSYSLTRFGRLSMNLTHAPIADERIQYLDGTNVLNPQNIRPNRGTNNRKFFNVIDWQYDFLDDNSTPQTTVKTIDTNSLNIIGIASVLPITAKGVRTDLGSTPEIERRTRFLMSRYKNGAVLINIEVNWETGCLIEAGDVIAIKDNGVLQISNFTSGSRNLGVALYEVINRDLNIKDGKVQLQVVSGLGAEATDRYAGISPSSIVQTGSTQQLLKISDSYGAKYPAQEYRKWQDYVGINLLVHSLDYATAATAQLLGFSPTDPNSLEISTISIAASALPGLVIDVAHYSTSTDPNDQAVVKTAHAFLSPQIAVTGVSASAFQVSPSDIGKIQVGFPVKVHTFDYSTTSPELTVASIDTGTYTITASSTFGFTPGPSGYYASYFGFADARATYRYI